MKLITILSVIFLLFSTFALICPDNADAARFGGGRSFGSRPFMNKPAAPPAVNRQQTQNPATPAAAPTPGRGIFGGMGGLFGGLLAGTLIGSLLGGHGFSGGGFMDIILIGILAFLGYTLYKKFKSRPAEATAEASQGSMYQQYQPSPQSGWDRLRGNNNYTVPTPSVSPNIPAGFDVEEFLRGAKMAYNRMQKAWDARDISDIAQFATPAVVAEIRKQLASDPTPSHTEIMLVNAQLLGVEDEGNDQRAQVYFDVLMREDPNQTIPETVKEIWHFLREGKNGNWRLDGIQQVD